MFSTKPKLAILLNRWAMGGVAIDLLGQLPFLQKHFDIILISGHPEPDEMDISSSIPEELKAAWKYVPEMKRSLHPLQDILAYKKIRQILLKEKPAILHTHGTKPGWIGRLAAFRVGIPVTIHTYHGHVFEGYFTKGVSTLIQSIDRYLARKTTILIALSECQKEELVNTFHIAAESKWRVVPQGIDPRPFLQIRPGSTSSSKFRDQWNISADTLVITTIGRFAPVKNLGLLVDVACLLLEKNPGVNILFMLTGDGTEKSSLQQQIRKKGFEYVESPLPIVPSRKHIPFLFTSWQTDIPSILEASDILCLTSKNEGFPLILLEAFAAARPLVASAVGSIPEVIQDGQNGFICPPGNADIFVDRLQSLLTNPALRIQLGSAGRETLLRHYSKELQAHQLVKLYQDCLSGL